jgi:ABC-type glycerol-3-phosphate transport system substrate-binding protein
MRWLTRGHRRQKRRPAAATLAMSLAGTAGAVFLAGCGGSNPLASSGSSGSSADLQMWIAGNSVTQPIYTAEAQSYSKSHPGVEISVIDLPGPAYSQKLDTALAAGEEPAIYQLYSPGPQMKTLVTGNKLASLTGMLNSNPSFKSRIIPVALSQGQLNGQQYGIPYNIFQEEVVLYSKPDFKKAGIASPPTSWPELMQDVSKLKNAGLIPVSISGAETNSWYELWLENYEVHLAGLGVTDQIEHGNLSALNSAPVITAATAMQELVKDGAFEPGYSTTSEANNVPYALLGTSKAAMLLYGAFTPNFVEQSVPGFVQNGDMGWFKFPAVPGGTGNNVVDLGSTPMLVVNSTMSKADIKAAENFLESFIYSPSQVTALAKTGNVGPAANAGSAVSQAAPSDLKSYMNFQLNETLHASQSFETWSNLMPTDTTSGWDNLLEELFTEKITPQQFAQQAAKM